VAPTATSIWCNPDKDGDWTTATLTATQLHGPTSGKGSLKIVRLNGKPNEFKQRPRHRVHVQRIRTGNPQPHSSTCSTEDMTPERTRDGSHETVTCNWQYSCGEEERGKAGVKGTHCLAWNPPTTTGEGSLHPWYNRTHSSLRFLIAQRVDACTCRLTSPPWAGGRTCPGPCSAAPWCPRRRACASR